MTRIYVSGGDTCEKRNGGRRQGDRDVKRERRRSPTQFNAAAQSIVMAAISKPVPSVEERVTIAATGYAVVSPENPVDVVRRAAFKRDGDAKLQAARRAWAAQLRRGQGMDLHDVEDAVIL